MRARRTVLTATVVTAALVLGACGGGEGGGTGETDGDGGAVGETGGEPSEVTLWMYPVIPDEDASRAFWETVEADFKADNSEIDLNVELLPWANRDEKIATALASGVGPDLVLLVPDQTLQYQSTGGLSPVDAAVEEERDAYLQSALDVVTFDDALYGVPIYHTSSTAVYNTKVFEEAGVEELPTTWDEVLEAAPALAANGVAVMDYSGSPELTLNHSFYPLLWQAGGSVFTEDGKDVAFDGPEGVAALQFLLDLQAVGGLPPDAATKANAVEGGPLGTGTAGMGYSVVKGEAETMQTALGEENVMVGEPLQDVEQVAFGIPGVLALTSISDAPDAAMEVARYIASPEVSTELNAASGTYPARTDVEPAADDELSQAFLAALEHAYPGEVEPSSRQVMAALASNLQAALQGQKSAEEALSDAAAESRDLIERSG